MVEKRFASDWKGIFRPGIQPLLAGDDNDNFVSWPLGSDVSPLIETTTKLRKMKEENRGEGGGK